MIDRTSHSTVELGSERSFGLVFACFFTIVAFWPLVFHGLDIRFWAIGLVLLFGCLGLFAPAVLRPLNRLWLKLGLLLGRIVTPIVMGIIFFTTVTPIGLIRRMMISDPLGQSFDPSAETYWVDRTKESEKITSMRKQF